MRKSELATAPNSIQRLIQKNKDRPADAQDRSLRFPTRIAANGQGQRRGEEESMTRSAEAFVDLMDRFVCFGLCWYQVEEKRGGGGLVAACQVLNTGFRMQADHDGALQ
jgi:hypothetical protein